MNIIGSFFGFLNDTIGVAVYDLVKEIFFMLDNVVYSLIPLLYKMILYLSNIDLYRNNQTLVALSNRVYILVGVFMLFKLSFSMIRYIADPNSFSDSSKGFTGLVKNVIISLVLLVSIPYLFNMAYQIQGDIISSNVIPNFILGTSGDLNMEDFESSAKDVQFIMFSPFFTVNPNAGGDFGYCAPETSQDGVVEYPLVNVLGSKDMALANDGKCLETIANELDNDDNMKSSGIQLTDFFKTEDGDNRNFGALGPLVVWRGDNNQSVINYTPIISTIFGGYLVFLLFSFCFDIGGRAIKLLFLQILSPIAVISSVDPTESSQNSKLKDWGSECLKTFASVFLRLAVIFVIIQIVNVITEFIFADKLDVQKFGNMGSPSSFESLFIYIFLVLGSFQAAKSLPGIIEKAFGVKLSGELNLNPFKNSFIAGTFGVGVGALSGGIAGAVAGAEAGAPLRGVLGGIGTGAMKGAGTKPGFGMFHDLRRKTYKDMTGNDFRSFNPLSKIYGVGGDKKVGEIKDVINQARNQLNLRHTRLNSVSSMNARRYRSLVESGIDPTKDSRSQAEIKTNRDAIKQRIDAQKSSISRNKSALSVLEQRKEAHQKVVDINKQIEQLSRQVNNPHLQTVPTPYLLEQIDKLSTQRDEQKKIAGNVGIDEIEKNIIRVQEEMKNRNNSVSQMQNEYNNEDMLYQYFEGVKEEDKLRSEIGSIEKDISTLDDQRRQMQQFYHIDSSTKQSVADARKHIEDRSEKDNL